MFKFKDFIYLHFHFTIYTHLTIIYCCVYITVFYGSSNTGVPFHLGVPVLTPEFYKGPQFNAQDFS